MNASAKFGNTSNLMKHLHLHHCDEFSEVFRAQTSTTDSSSCKSKAIDDK